MQCREMMLSSANDGCENLYKDEGVDGLPYKSTVLVQAYIHCSPFFFFHSGDMVNCHLGQSILSSGIKIMELLS